MQPVSPGPADRAIVKSTAVPDATAQLETLQRLRGRIPVPPLARAADGSATIGALRGVPAQQLLEDGRASAVFRACGVLLRRLHGLEVGEVAAHLSGTGRALVHGDFGVHNVLLDPTTLAVTGVLRWEWARKGDGVEDLAWFEWIVRGYCEPHLDLLTDFFSAYRGDIPPWTTRQAAMLTGCRERLDFHQRTEPGGPGVARWKRRLVTTATWTG